MKLPKPTREDLYKAEGKPVLIDWPELDAPRVTKGKRYPVYTEEGNLAFQIRVEGKRGDQVVARIDHDPVRLLGGLPGTRNEAGDWEPEPERVNAEYEAKLAMEGSAKGVILRGEHKQRQRTGRAEAKAGRGKQAAEAAIRQRERLATG